MWARAPLWVAVGRLGTTPLLDTGASLRRRRAHRGRLHVGGMGGLVGGGPVGQRRFGLGDGPSRCSLLPSLSFRVVGVTRAFVSGNPWPGRVRPVSPWPAAGRRIRVASEWRERRHGAPPAGGLVAPPRPARRRGRSARPAGPRITKGRVGGSKRKYAIEGLTYGNWGLKSRGSVGFIFLGPSGQYTLLVLR